MISAKYVIICNENSVLTTVFRAFFVNRVGSGTVLRVFTHKQQENPHSGDFLLIFCPERLIRARSIQGVFGGWLISVIAVTGPSRECTDQFWPGSPQAKELSRFPVILTTSPLQRGGPGFLGHGFTVSISEGRTVRIRAGIC
jgi:hypothetical protein